MKEPSNIRRFDEATGKLHMQCPHSEKTGIYVHVVIRDGYCYRSGECMVVECRFNRLQGDIKSLLSITW